MYILTSPLSYVSFANIVSVYGLSSHSLDAFLPRAVFYFSNVQEDYMCVCMYTHTHINIYLFILAASVLSCGPGPMRWVEMLAGFEVLGFPSEEPVLPWRQSPESDTPHEDLHSDPCLRRRDDCPLSPALSGRVFYQRNNTPRGGDIKAHGTFTA